LNLLQAGHYRLEQTGPLTKLDQALAVLLQHIQLVRSPVSNQTRHVASFRNSLTLVRFRAVYDEVHRARPDIRCLIGEVRWNGEISAGQAIAKRPQKIAHRSCTLGQ
jgi:hypothetical protein